MKCCCNRSTAGIIIGSIYILGSIIVAIFAILSIFKTIIQDEERKRMNDIEGMYVIAKVICNRKEIPQLLNYNGDKHFATNKG